MKLFRMLAVAAIAAASVTTQAQAQDINVGVILPLSGPVAPNGQDLLKGINLAAETLNAKGGVLGRKLNIISTDDESTPAIGVSRANELIAKKVDVVVGGWNSPVSLAYQPVLVRAGVLDITSNSKADEIITANANPYAIKINTASAADGDLTARFVAKNMQAKRIAFVTENDVYGASVQRAIEEGLKRYSPGAYEIVATEKFPFKQLDFRTILENVRLANADVMIVTQASQGTGMPALVQQYAELGIKTPMVTMVGGLLDSALTVAGASANGIISSDTYFPDMKPFSDIAANRDFATRYQAKYGKPPEKMAAQGYVTMQVWAAAVEKAKSLDREKVGPILRDGTFPDTIFGDAKFVNGQMDGRYVVFKMVDGKRQLIDLK
jgi:branched-chain amino acid transport system substrate-binding protein